MILNKLALAAALAVACGAMAFAPTANAADTGTITINGKVLNSTCSVSGNGGSNDFSVTLPPVAASDLASAGTVKDPTKFTLTLTDCPITPSGVKVGTQFYSTANTLTSGSTNGLLKNATGSAGNVAVQLLDSSNAAIVVASAAPAAGDTTGVTDQQTVTSSGTPAAAGTITMDYFAQYYATGAATAGDLSTTVTYQINYQ